MKTTLRVLVVLLGLLICCPSWAQEKKVFEVVKIADGLYELSIDAGGYPDKVIASVGDDGLLIVDSADPDTGKALAKALAAFGKGLPKIIINTHSHIEHLGGNAELGQNAVIIGHANLRDRYLNGLYSIGDFPKNALPGLTFTDSMTLHFNGQEIRLAAFPGAHDDSDILVWFTRSRVAVVGALCMGEHFPSIDGDVGNILKYPEVTARALAYLPDDARLVPAHAADCTMADARRFLDMLVKTGSIVRSAMDQGKDLARMKAEDVLAAYASFESAYVKRNDWLEYWYDAYTIPRSTRPRPYAPVLEALRTKDAKAAVDVYSGLRRTHADEYWFDDMGLMYMGRRLARRGRPADGIVFLDRCIAEYPGSEGAAISHRVLSTVYEQMGERGNAAQHMSAYLEKHPEDQDAQKHLVELGLQRESTDEQSAIKKVIRDSIGWALTKDRERLEQIIAHDTDLFMFNPDSKSTVRGWEAFARNFDVWMDPRFKATGLDIRDLRVTLARGGDVSWFSAILDDLGEWDGKPTGWRDTRWTGVLEKRDGNWVIVQMHFSFAVDKVRAEAQGAAKM